MIHDTCFEVITLEIALPKIHSITKRAKSMYMYAIHAWLDSIQKIHPTHVNKSNTVSQ